MNHLKLLLLQECLYLPRQQRRKGDAGGSASSVYRDRRSYGDDIVTKGDVPGTGAGGDDLYSVPHTIELVVEVGNMGTYPTRVCIVIRRDESDVHKQYFSSYLSCCDEQRSSCS